LIRKLKKLDPNGNWQVCIDNAPIMAVDKVESFVDGPLEVLQYDKATENVSGVKITQKGYKIRLHKADVEDVIGSWPDIPIDLSGIEDEKYRVQLEQSLYAWRDRVMELKQDLQEELKNKDEERLREAGLDGLS